MNVSRFARVVGFGVALGIAIPAVADAMPQRVYDPTTHSFVTYQPAQPDKNRPLDPQYQAQVVSFETTEAPGTVIVDTANKFLYFVLQDGLAIRYGVGVGREGFGWSGTVQVGAKQEWPTWTPPAEMIERRPELVKYTSGMPGGPENPLGARAMYLGTTVYRIHGTNRPDTIGTAVSSGCFRLVNADVADLYERVPVGTKVIIRQKPEL